MEMNIGLQLGLGAQILYFYVFKKVDFGRRTVLLFSFHRSNV